MPVFDLSRAGAGNALSLSDCDICIVGSGPAGSTVVRRLSETGLRIVLLESGGFERRAESDELDEIDNIGRPRANQWSVRNRIVGGSSHTWGGRCAPFDEIDFQKRDWVPDSGWPIASEALTAYLDESAAYLGLARGTGFTDDGFWRLAGRKLPEPSFDAGKLLPFFWQFSRDQNESYPYEYMRFGRHLADQIGSTVALVAGATVLRIATSQAGDAASAVEFAMPDGTQGRLRAKAIVLCAGGVENARLLLVSNDVFPEGLGNRHNLVGRYLMDHLRGPVAQFDVAGTRALQKRFGRYNVEGRFFRAGLRLSPAIQARETLLNCAVWLGETLAPDDPWDAVRRLLGGRSRPADAATLLANAPTLLRSAKDYFVDRNGIVRKLSAITLECMVEQRPDPESRLTLSGKRDRFGTPLARIDWRSHSDEARTMHRMARLVADEFRRVGFPVPIIAEWVADEAPVPLDFVDVAHPTGTTRMSGDPARGVVDPMGRVHGVRDLYIAGSSTFPTAGHCNPTQMIVALALRTADAVKAKFVTDASPAARPAPATSRSERKSVLLTGATGRIGRVLLQDLVERGYRVKATTSKNVDTAAAADANVQWTQFDFIRNDGYDDLVAGCEVVFHLAAEIGKMERMQTVNTEATLQLALAAERQGVKSFCYVSTVSVYGSGRVRRASEDAEVLTLEKDVRSEYWALDYVRAYGRTKLGGERAIRDVARNVRYAILRPTVVVDVRDLIDIRNWNFNKRMLAAHRHAHHVYVRDVADAIIWSTERISDEDKGADRVETFNLSEDEFAEATYAQFMRKAFAASGDARYRIAPVPWMADWLHDFLRFRTLPLRSPLWRMRFPNDRLRDAGYRFRFGMGQAYASALDALKDEARNAAVAARKE